MKKLGILMMPLMAMSLLACNNGGEDKPTPGSKTINSQEELTNALTFAGVEYLQDKSWSMSDNCIAHEFSSTVYHIGENKLKPNSEKYYQLEGQTLWEYSYDKEKAGFTKTIDTEQEHFVKIEQLYDLYGFDTCVALGLNYNSLTYNDGVYTYDSSKIQETFFRVLLQFDTKKLTSIEMYEIRGEKEEREFKYEFAYEEKEIPLPTPVE